MLLPSVTGLVCVTLLLPKVIISVPANTVLLSNVTSLLLHLNAPAFCYGPCVCYIITTESYNFSTSQYGFTIECYNPSIAFECFCLLLRALCVLHYYYRKL